MPAIDPRYPFCFFLTGPSSSGKSTMRHTLTTHPLLRDAVVLSPDDLILEIAKEEGLTFTECYGTISGNEFRSIDKRLLNKCHKSKDTKQSLIIDRCNLTVEDRAPLLDRVPTSFNRIGIHFVWDEKTLLERNAKRGWEHRVVHPEVLFDQIDRYQVPTTAEFDAVFEIVNPFALPF